MTRSFRGARLDDMPPRYATRVGQAAARYAIRIRGTIGLPLAGPLERMSVERVGDESVIVGEVADQAALQGALRSLWDLGVEIVSFNPLDGRPRDQS